MAAGWWLLIGIVASPIIIGIGALVWLWFVNRNN